MAHLENMLILKKLKTIQNPDFVFVKPEISNE
jgi:hypothetical protein